jgi:hypothetical protein
MHNSGVIPSEKSPFPFSKDGLISQGRNSPFEKRDDKGGLSSTSAGAVDWSFSANFWATTLA